MIKREIQLQHIIGLVGVLVSGAMGCGMRERLIDPRPYRAQRTQVNVADGVDQREAIILAQNYLLDEGYNHSYVISKPQVGESYLVDGCWAVGFPTTWKTWWEQRLKWLAVHIDKNSGEVKSLGWGPS